MRDDFKKVLCEEPRRLRRGAKALNKLPGYKKKAQKNRRGDYGEWNFPKKESMRARGGWHRGTKVFGEHLGPLVRFLRSSVGRKWDDVYSEIAKVCPNNSAVSGHIYEHLWGYVETKPAFEDGRPYDSAYGYSGIRHYIVDRGQDNTFYVDKEGLLCRAPLLKRVKNKVQNTIHKASGKIYIKVEGVWHEGLFRRIPKKQPRTVEFEGYNYYTYKFEVIDRPDFDDIFVGMGSWCWGRLAERTERKMRLCYKVYGKKVHCYDKVKLSPKELKKLGLVNKEATKT